MCMPTLIVCWRVVGYKSSTSCFIAAVPLNKSNCVPGGSNPEEKTKVNTKKTYAKWNCGKHFDLWKTKRRTIAVNRKDLMYVQAVQLTRNREASLKCKVQSIAKTTKDQPTYGPKYSQPDHEITEAWQDIEAFRSRVWKIQKINKYIYKNFLSLSQSPCVHILSSTIKSFHSDQTN